MHDPLLGVGRNGGFRLLHRKDDIPPVLGNLREHCEHEQIDRSGALPVEGGGVIAFSRRDECRNHLAQVFAREIGNF